MIDGLSGFTRACCNFTRQVMMRVAHKDLDLFAMTHPLDRPIWNSLLSDLSHICDRGDGYVRFHPDKGPFIAPETFEPAHLDAVASTIEPGGDASLLELEVLPPPNAISATALPVWQMIADAFPPVAPIDGLVELGEQEDAEMLAIALQMRPGPFRAGTPRIGRYVGLKDENGKLITMGGERFAVPGMVEVSALCTYPEHQGKGYGKAMLQAIASRIVRDGKTPFLHVYEHNAPAITLYERMGFRHRQTLQHMVWRRET